MTASSPGVSHMNDGDGNRIEKSSGKIYWYGAGTEILDESDTSGNFTNEYVFFGGKRVAMRVVSSGNIYYYAADMLGSARTQRGLPGRRRVEPGGSVQAGQTAVCYDADFLPYGQEVDYTSTRKGSQVPGKGSLGDRSNYKFEGKERDLETGNDNFGARYYRSALGRWLSAAERAPRSPVRGAWEIGTRSGSAIPVPVPYANLTNPQTLNLYAMVSDNPETFADLDGHLIPGGPYNLETGDISGTGQGPNCDYMGGNCSKQKNANTNVNGHDQDPVQKKAQKEKKKKPQTPQPQQPPQAQTPPKTATQTSPEQQQLQKCHRATYVASGLGATAAMNGLGALLTGGVTPVSWYFEVIGGVETVGAGAMGIYAAYVCFQQ